MCIKIPKRSGHKYAVGMLIPFVVGYTTTEPWQPVLHQVEHDPSRFLRVQNGILITGAPKSIMGDSVAQKLVQIVGIRMSEKWSICKR